MKMGFPLKLLTFLPFALGLVLTSFGAATYANAEEERIIRLDLASAMNLSTAVGLIISNNKTTEKLNSRIEKVANGNYRISIPYLASEVSPNSVACALVLSEQGDAAFSTVKAITGDEFEQPLSLIPDCQNDKVISSTISGQLALIEQLVDVRGKLRGVGLSKTKQILNGEFLEKLQKLERGFGLTRDKDLSPTLPPLELIDRLSRIQVAVKGWNNKKAQINNTTSPAEVSQETKGPGEENSSQDASQL